MKSQKVRPLGELSLDMREIDTNLSDAQELRRTKVRRKFADGLFSLCGLAVFAHGAVADHGGERVAGALTCVVMAANRSALRRNIDTLDVNVDVLGAMSVMAHFVNVFNTDQPEADVYPQDRVIDEVAFEATDIIILPPELSGDSEQ